MQSVTNNFWGSFSPDGIEAASSRLRTIAKSVYKFAADITTFSEKKGFQSCNVKWDSKIAS
jgi:fumarate hydratase class II